MDLQEQRSQVTEMGRKLLEEGLVVRTWGNISCRVDDESFLITPSGLDYNQTKNEDLAVYNLRTDEWSGPHKPSSEKGVHAVAYELFKDAGFVIHTHQAFATAFSVYGVDELKLMPDEEEALGGLAEAEYGLPGTKKLKNNVRTAMESGAHTILMENHGVVIVGKDAQEAYERALLLEKICKREWFGKVYIKPKKPLRAKIRADVIEKIRETFPLASWVATPAAVTWSGCGRPIVAQLDDMAQMIGRKLTVVEARDIYTLEEVIFGALEEKNAVLVRGLGAVVNGEDEDDTEALKALVDKACITALHTYAAKVNCHLSFADCELMRFIYLKKYSKLKKGN